MFFQVFSKSELQGYFCNSQFALYTHQLSGCKARYQVSLARQILQEDPMQCEFNHVPARVPVIPLSRNREEERRKTPW